jgi:DNA repair protein RAD16
LVVEDSIEAKILQLQDKKLAMTQAALATDPDSALGKLTEEVGLDSLGHCDRKAQN